MKKNKIIYLLLIFVLLATTGASCSGCFGAKDKGVYKSEDYAENWNQKSFIKKEGRKTYTIADDDILCFAFDPLNSDVLYAGTKEKGVIVTKNGGENWERTSQTTGNVYSISIDPVDTNTIYATVEYYIMKTIDGGVNWDIIHTDAKKNNFTKIIVDNYDNNKIYASSKTGLVYKSKDKGITWDVKLQIDEDIMDLYIRTHDTRILYALTEKGNILKTASGGEPTSDDINTDEDDDEFFNNAWQSIFSEDFEDQWKDAKKTKALYISEAEPNTIYAISQYGILKTLNEGGVWQEYKTLIPLNDKENENIINFQIDPVNTNNIYFTVKDSNKIHKSTDGGIQWKIIENFPSKKNIISLITNPTNDNIIYVGMEEPEDDGSLFSSRSDKK